MNPESLKSLLTSVAQGQTPINAALDRLRALPFEDAGGFATLDHHRHLRCGHPEVIFCQGKSTEQVLEIARRLAANQVHIPMPGPAESLNAATAAAVILFEAARQRSM